MKVQTCGTCNLAEFPCMTAHKIPRPKPGRAGSCRWKLYLAAPLPICLKIATTREWICPELSGCPCWTAKEAAK